MVKLYASVSNCQFPHLYLLFHRQYRLPGLGILKTKIIWLCSISIGLKPNASGKITHGESMGYVSMMPGRVELILWEEVWIHMYNDSLTQLWAKYFVTFPCVVRFGLPSAILALSSLEHPGVARTCKRPQNFHWKIDDSCVSPVFPVYPLRNDFFHWRSLLGNKHFFLGLVCTK